MSIRGMPFSVCCCAHMSSVVCAAGSRSKRYFRQAWGSISLALAISDKDNSMALRVSTLGGSGEEPVFSIQSHGADCGFGRVVAGRGMQVTVG